MTTKRKPTPRMIDALRSGAADDRRIIGTEFATSTKEALVGHDLADWTHIGNIGFAICVVTDAGLTYLAELDKAAEIHPGQTEGLAEDAEATSPLPGTPVTEPTTAHSLFPTLEGMAALRAELTPGPAAFTLTGPNLTYTRETRDRVRAAIANSQIDWPAGHLTVTAHWTVVRGGHSADLAIACTALAAAGHIDPKALQGITLIGELGLDGRLRSVCDLEDIIRSARDAGCARFVVPAADLARFHQAPGTTAEGMSDLGQVLSSLNASAEKVSVPLTSFAGEKQERIPGHTRAAHTITLTEPGQRGIAYSFVLNGADTDDAHHALYQVPSFDKWLDVRCAWDLPDLEYVSERCHHGLPESGKFVDLRQEQAATIGTPTD